MHKITHLVICAITDRKGQDMVEYALIAGSVSVAAGFRFSPSR